MEYVWEGKTAGTEGWLTIVRLSCPAETPIFNAVTSANTNTGLIRLDELPPRICAVVRSIETDDEETLRLKTMGVCVGRRVELVRKGDPLVLKVFGSRLGISSSLASRVQVEVCQPGHCALRETDCA